MKKMVMIALALALLLAACGKETPAPQTVSIALDSNPTTGFSWQAAQSEELFKIESSYAVKDHPEGMVGVGGTETFTLTPLKAGKTEVTFTYARAWGGGEQADQVVYTFEIDKNFQVKMLDGYSTGAEEPIPAPSPEIK